MRGTALDTELLELEIETFEVSDVGELAQTMAADSCTSTTSSCTSTSATTSCI